MKLHSFWLILWMSKSLSQVEVTPIVGGRIVKSSSEMPKYPFIVSLQEMLNRREVRDRSLEPCVLSNQSEMAEYQHFCGGSLVHRYWVLTAAHCLWRKDLERVIAIIGYEDISFVDTLDNYDVKHVEYIYFEPTNYQNDIALLRLQKPYAKSGFEWSDFAKLPAYGMKAKIKKPCQIIGYGAKQHAGEIQKNLYEGEVYLISKQQCRRVLGHIWAPQNGENTVCALGNNQDTCQGDSGGPLICDYNGVNYIYGIVSHGLTCGISGIPSIYTVAIPYVDWINLVIKD